MQVQMTAAFNLRPDGSIVMDGDYAPGTSLGVPLQETGLTAARTGIGLYRIEAPGLYVPTGWKATVFRDENDEPTIRVSLGLADGVLTLSTTDPDSGEPKDIVNLLTLRVGLTVEFPVYVDPPILNEPGEDEADA